MRAGAWQRAGAAQVGMLCGVGCGRRRAHHSTAPSQFTRFRSRHHSFYCAHLNCAVHGEGSARRAPAVGGGVGGGWSAGSGVGDAASKRPAFRRHQPQSCPWIRPGSHSGMVWAIQWGMGVGSPGGGMSGRAGPSVAAGGRREKSCGSRPPLRPAGPEGFLSLPRSSARTQISGRQRSTISNIASVSLRPASPAPLSAFQGSQARKKRGAGAGPSG